MAACPEYIEDARDLLFNLADRDAIIDATLEWIRSSTVAGYHGTRLTHAEVDSVRAKGLLPLKAEARRDRLVRALSSHPRWRQVADRLDELIQAHGQGARAGRREDQVHLTLSRSGLMSGFNHYLTHGSEFDQHVAHALLGSQGKELLSQDGAPTLIKCAIPGDVALDAAHPFFSIDDLRSRGDVPNLVDEFLKTWSYKLAHPDFQACTLEVDCGMFFCEIVPAGWIIYVKVLEDTR